MSDTELRHERPMAKGEEYEESTDAVCETCDEQLESEGVPLDHLYNGHLIKRNDIDSKNSLKSRGE